MTTPAQLINLALKQANVLGVGQTASSEDMNDAFTLLKQMMASWQRRRYIIYHLVNLTATVTGASSYTIGAGQTFNIARPAKIESAFYRQTAVSPAAPVDYPIEILRAREDYDRITLKSLQTWPRYLFFDTNYPTGNVYVWPIPTQGEIHISVMSPIQTFATIDDVLVLPPEYEEALMYNLCLRIYPLYGLPVNPGIAALARASLSILQEGNTQIPRLRIPGELTSSTGRYNVYSDSISG